MRVQIAFKTSWLLVLVGCGGQTMPPVEHAKAPAPEAAPIAKAEAARDKSVGVVGIEGTLSEHQVHAAIEKRLKDLARCQGDNMERVPHLAGSVQVGIHVLRDGSVSQVTVQQSSIGDRPTETCIAAVVGATRFPRPNGGEADVSWSMVIDEQGRGPAHLDAKRITRQIKRAGGALRETCELESGRGSIAITAYVDRSGEVITAGAAAKEAVPDAQLDCVTEDVRGWRLPKGNRVSKVSFEL